MNLALCSWETFFSKKVYRYFYHYVAIDLFTVTAAILNLLYLWSIMGCRGGNSLSIYARFSGKKRTSLYISGEKAIIITSNHGITTFFPHYNFRIVLKPPGHPLILLKSNSVIQYGRRIGKKVCYLCLCVNISDNFRRDKRKQESLIV